MKSLALGLVAVVGGVATNPTALAAVQACCDAVCCAVACCLGL